MTEKLFTRTLRINQPTSNNAFAFIAPLSFEGFANIELMNSVIYDYFKCNSNSVKAVHRFQPIVGCAFAIYHLSINSSTAYGFANSSIFKTFCSN